jgi:hypothetical protein
MSYGVNGSVIGPENAPTTSAASGVWSLGEVAESVRDGIWPEPQYSFEKIATITPGTGTGTLTFSSIPATYKHLEVIFFSSSTTATYQGDPVSVTNDVSGTSGYNYVYQTMSGTGSSAMAETNIANQPHGKGPYQGDDTHGSVGRMLFTNYANATGSWLRAGDGKPMIFEGAAFHTNTSNKYARPIFGQSEKGGNNDAALTSITIVSPGYNFLAEAKFVLYGLREA